MSMKIITVFLSSLYVIWALQNSSCEFPTHQEILLGNNVRTQATKIICDDHIEISINETIGSGSYQTELLSSLEKEREAKGFVTANNNIDAVLVKTCAVYLQVSYTNIFKREF